MVTSVDDLLVNPFPSKWVLRALIDFTLSNARRFYSSMGNLLDRKGLRNELHFWWRPVCCACRSLACVAAVSFPFPGGIEQASDKAGERLGWASPPPPTLYFRTFWRFSSPSRPLGKGKEMAATQASRSCSSSSLQYPSFPVCLTAFLLQG